MGIRPLPRVGSEVTQQTDPDVTTGGRGSNARFPGPMEEQLAQGGQCAGPGFGGAV